MSRRPLISLFAAALIAVVFVGFVAQSGSAMAPPLTPKPPKPPREFFGIGPQTMLTDRDAAYMKAGGIEVVRWPLSWGGVQPTHNAPYDWGAMDQVVAVAARHGLRVLPFVYSSPRWIGKETRLPVDSGRARRAWAAFLGAAVRRYGPGGEFWREYSPGVIQYEPAITRPLPIRKWQIWNEANFFYFAFPVSPTRYARLLKFSAPAIKAVDPGARIVLTGLFGEPTARGRRGMPATKFMERLYRVPGIKSLFDGVALHPYAVDAETLEELVEGLRGVTVEYKDRVPNYITVLGWGSENNFLHVAFELGFRGQV